MPGDNLLIVGLWGDAEVEFLGEVRLRSGIQRAYDGRAARYQPERTSFDI